jgi:sialic acid synthase SpsE
VVKARRFPPVVPYVVAAVDRNHGGRLGIARRLLTIAAEAKADGVKLVLPASGAAGPRLPEAAWPTLRKDARGRLDFIVAPQDRQAFAVARGLKPDAYQVDPGVISDLDLVRRIARERRPVLVSTAGATSATIGAAVRVLRGCRIVLLHAVAADVLAPDRARLRYITWLAAHFKKPVGYFGREPGTAWSYVAVTIGAVVIEKLLTIDHALPGPDRAASLDPGEFQSLVQGLKDLTAALAPVRDRRVFADELRAVEERGRSLVARRPMPKGHVLRASDLDARTTADGISPRLIEWLTGRTLRYDVEAGDPLTFGVVDIR